MFIADKTLNYNGLSMVCLLPEHIRMDDLLQKYSEGVVKEPGEADAGYGPYMFCFQDQETKQTFIVYERHKRLRVGCNPAYNWKVPELVEQLRLGCNGGARLVPWGQTLR
jgi:hypothetical protein